MTVARVTTRTYDPASGNLVTEVEIEVTTPEVAPNSPASPKRASNVVTLRPVGGCPPDCKECDADARAEARERLFQTARDFGWQVRYTPTPTTWWSYSAPVTVTDRMADALRRVFV
jgi:hypothetical protein